MNSFSHDWTQEEYNVVSSRVCNRCNENEVGERIEAITREREEARSLLAEAYLELSAIEAITVSPSGIDGLLDLVNRINKHLNPLGSK